MGNQGMVLLNPPPKSYILRTYAWKLCNIKIS